MGQQRQRLLRFLAAHPTCCFCGGNTPATTRDHIPPSSIFSGHRWPEGYEFPACFKCNSGSSKDDAIVALWSRINSVNEPTPSEREEWLKLLRAFNEHYPGEAQKTLLTANEKRRWFKEYKIEKPADKGYGEMPMIRFTPLIRGVIERFARKLTLAFHYKHTQKIVPSDGWLLTRLWTNAHRISGEFPQEIFEVVPGSVELLRDNRSLGDQFSYKFGTSEDGQIGSYLATFRKAFAIVGLVVFDASLMRDFDDTALGDAARTEIGEEPI